MQSTWRMGLQLLPVCLLNVANVPHIRTSTQDRTLNLGHRTSPLASSMPTSWRSSGACSITWSAMKVNKNDAMGHLCRTVLLISKEPDRSQILLSNHRYASIALARYSWISLTYLFDEKSQTAQSSPLNRRRLSSGIKLRISGNNTCSTFKVTEKEDKLFDATVTWGIRLANFTLVNRCQTPQHYQG